MKRYWFSFVAILFAILLVAPAMAETTGQIGGMNSSGDYYWTVDDDGTLIGATGAEISLGGEEKSSWGSVVSPMTDYTGYVAPTDAGSKLKLHDDGDLTLGGAVATNVVITFDSDSNDYYVGVNDTENELQIGYGSTIGTTEQISIQSSGVIVIGEDTDVDSGFVFQAGAQDFYMGVDYTGGEEEDLFTIGLGATIGTTPEIAIGKSSGMVYIEALTSKGSADLDIGEAGVTDVTVTTDGGAIILDGTITLTDGEVISNATDDTVRIASNDVGTILEVYATGASDTDASILLTADADADAGDRWQITNDGDDSNNLTFMNDASSADTVATKFTIGKTGVVTTINYIESKITDTSTTAVVDVMKLTHDAGTAAGGVGTGLVFQVDDAGGIEEQASIDVSLSTVTDGSEDADFIINLNQAGTMRKVFEIDSDLGDAGTNVLEYTGWTTQTNAVVDLVEFKLETPGDTSTAGLGMGISFQIEDETDVVEEQASIDIIVTDATTIAENADFVINLNNIGTMREAFRIDTDVTATASTAFELTSWTLQTDAVQDVLELTLDNTLDTATDDIGLGISIIIEQEDSGTPVEQSSIDFVLTDAGTGAEDCDVIFSQVVGGTLEERVRFDSDSKTISAVGTTPIIAVGDGGNEDNTILLDGQSAKDFYIATDNADDSLIIGVGSAVGTDSRITVQDNATETRIELGDAVTAEDTVVVFDGNGFDFYMALDDDVDDLVFGVGAVVATTPAFAIDEDRDVTFSGNIIVEGALDLGTVQAFTDTDADPDVSDGSYFITDGVAPGETITDFDGTGIVAGQIIVIETNYSDITFDVTDSGLKGGSTDIVTSDGDTTTWIYNGTDWLLISYMDMAEDQN